MSAQLVETDAYIGFRDWLEQECGICIAENKLYLLETRLMVLMAQQHCDTFEAFYRQLRFAADANLKRQIIDAMTTNETYWFRDEAPFKVLEEVIFPALAKQQQMGEKRAIRIWSAACSTGQEPYSIAMVASEYARKTNNPQFLNGLEIVATDISPSAIQLAQMATYDFLAMSRGLPETYKTSYFEPHGHVFKLNDTIKRMVTFKTFNLQHAFAGLGRFDMVLMRNVAIYFSLAFKQDLILRLANTLNPPGYFMMGSTETLCGFEHPFERLTHGRGIYYQLSGAVQNQGGL